MQKDARTSAFKSFEDVSMYLYENINKNNCYLTFESLIPFIVNGALACELGLKAIIVDEGGEYGRIHELDKLFNLMLPSTQKEIIESISMLKDENKDNEFVELIKKTSMNFKEWRYYFDYDKLETNWIFLHDLIIAIDKYIFD